MSRKSPRIARQFLRMKCKYGDCKREYIAFRRTSLYCSPDCRKRSYIDKKAFPQRRKILRKYLNSCSKCGATLVRLFVRKVGNKRVPLCGTHNVELSRAISVKNKLSVAEYSVKTSTSIVEG